MFIAMKTVGTILTAAFALLPWCFSPLLAQQSVPAGDKKVVITKRTLDADGTETTETIVKKGKAAENFNVDQYIKENRADNVELDVRVTAGDDDDRTVIVRRHNNRENDDQYDYNYNYRNDFDFEMGEELAAAFGNDNRAFLGVEEDSDENPDEPGLTVEVVRGSAADKAGLRTNDVILRLNGSEMNEWDQLSEIIGKAKPGDKMKIVYSRNGKKAETEATLTKRSEIKRDAEDQKRGFLGITDGDDDWNDEGEATDGVKIDVTEDGAAAKAGLRDGDQLLQLNDTPIKDWEDITDFMSYTRPGEKVRVTYKRGGKQNVAEASLGEQKAKSLNFDWTPKDIRINIREKEACLGVYSSASGEGDTRGAKISDFTTESAAREAQMNAGDVITAINGTRVEGHDELWNEIAKYQPGEKVAVEYLRDNQPARVEATLKACRDNSNRVMLFSPDESGDKRREFTLWNWEKDDQTRLRNNRVITIRRGAEGDAPTLETKTDEASAADRGLKLDNFRAYPNPSQGQVTVEFRSEPLPTVVSLLDISGRQLFREELNAFNGQYFQQFDLSEYAKGNIVIHVQQGEKVFTEQIIVN